MSKTIAVHVRYKSLYISLASSARRRLGDRPPKQKERQHPIY